jgi:hypothetical protein
MSIHEHLPPQASGFNGTNGIVQAESYLRRATEQKRGVGAAIGGIVWGMSLLTVLTYVLARHRKVSAMSEPGEPLTFALVIVFASKSIGHWIARM